MPVFEYSVSNLFCECFESKKYISYYKEALIGLLKVIGIQRNIHSSIIYENENRDRVLVVSIDIN